MLRVLLTSVTLGLLSFTSPSSPSMHTVSAEIAVVAAPAKKAALTFAEKQLAFDQHTQFVYAQAELAEKGLPYDVFRQAFVGYQNLKRQHKIDSRKAIVSIVDFTKSSRQKRMWVIDLQEKEVLFHTLVAHGRNTGEERAVRFSNELNSYMSSLGFYVTESTYYGKHGRSLRLNGMDEEFNSNALARSIIVHGADYVSETFVKQHGRLGRSLGCPSVPREISGEVIDVIKDKTVFYIHGDDNQYASDYLNDAAAVEAYAAAALLGATHG